jgi:5'-nucleotidase (lipoprotein e(P4) family)
MVSPAHPCNPGHTILNATLWLQQSVEYRAAALGTYAAARHALDAALADPSWTAATEDVPHDSTQPPAVILDLDETALDNSPFQSRVIRAGQTFDAKTWQKWTEEAAAPAVPGAAEFLQYAKSRGVTPFYITNRDAPEEAPGTLENLKRLGFPLMENGENLMLRGGRPEWKSDKSGRRAHVAASYRVLLLIGDDFNDFQNARDKNAAERDAMFSPTESWWGTRWFMLPNPMYGSWERAIIGSGGEPCDQVERKVKALH